MAVLEKLPSLEVIGGFRGTIDFYVHCGTPCARSWPRSPGKKRAPLVEAQWDTFAFSGSYWKWLPLEIKEAYNTMAIGQPVTGRELFTKSFISGDIVHITGH